MMHQHDGHTAVTGKLLQLGNGRVVGFVAGLVPALHVPHLGQRVDDDHARVRRLLDPAPHQINPALFQPRHRAQQGELGGPRLPAD
jgi:hypothetical protein